MQEVVEKYRNIQKHAQSHKDITGNRFFYKEKRGNKSKVQICIEKEVYKEFIQITRQIFGYNNKTVMLNDIIRSSEEVSMQSEPNGLQGWFCTVLRIPEECVNILESKKYKQKIGKPTHNYWLNEQVKAFNNEWNA